MKNIIVIFIALCQTIIPLYAQTQPYYFNKLYGEPFPFLEYPVVGLAKDSGYMLFYGIFDAYTNEGKLRTVKLNEAGDTLWKKEYGDPKTNIQSSNLIKIENNNYLLLCSERIKISTNFAKYELKLIKFDENGDSLWAHNYSTGKLFCVGAKVMQLPDHNIMITGISGGYDTLTMMDLDWQALVIKTDSIGNLLWMKEYGEVNWYEKGLDIAPTADGGFLVAGLAIYRYSPGDFQGYLLKIDGAGNKVWAHRRGNPNWLDGYGCIKASADGNYFLAGGVNYQTPCQDCGQSWLLKITPDDQIIWQKKYLGPRYNEFNDLIENPDGTLMVAGRSSDTPDFKQAGVLFRISATGDSLWSKIYTSNPMGNAYFSDILRTRDHGYIVSGVGFGPFNPGVSNASDAWLLKVDSLGCDSVGCYTTATTELPTEPLEGLYLYPNPATDLLHIAYRTENTTALSVAISDYTGKKLQTLSLDPASGSLDINTSALPNGLYLCTLYDSATHRQQSVKFVVMR